MGIKNPGKGITLTDSSGVVLPLAEVNGKNKELYKIEISVGETTSYFYIDINGRQAFELTNVFVSVDQARTLVGTLQFYRDGTWVDNSAYDFDMSATDSQKINGLYPLEEHHHGFPKRVKCTVGAGTTCNLFCQAIVT